MSTPPLTQLEVSPEEARAIREAVRRADPRGLGPRYRLAGPEHAAGLTALLADPAVSDPIYDLPRPITLESISNWITEARRRRQAGEGLLAVMLDETDAVCSYSYFTVWPERSAAEIAGAYRADQQSQGVGKAGAARSFRWMFETFGVRLICLTAALDNARSARVIEAAGFRPMGERLSTRPDGSTRRSRYWELMSTEVNPNRSATLQRQLRCAEVHGRSRKGLAQCQPKQFGQALVAGVAGQPQTAACCESQEDG